MTQNLKEELGEAAFNQVVNKYMTMKGVKPTGQNRNRAVDYLNSNPERFREIATELELLVEGDDGELKVNDKPAEAKEPFDLKKAISDGEEEKATGRE